MTEEIPPRMESYPAAKVNKRHGKSSGPAQSLVVQRYRYPAGSSVAHYLQWFAIASLVYLLLVSVSLIGGGFKASAGSHARELFAFASNPITGLFIGTICTALIQSSSTVTSIIVGLVAGGLPVSIAIPMVMGANIGTTITNTAVSFGHIKQGKEFQRAFAAATELGWRPVAHAGEEGPPSYIREALDLLGVERVDHGVRCLEDEALVQRLVDEQIPLTVCPFSNVKLRVFDQLSDHNLPELVDRGLCVTINSDDPSYFGGYLLDNYLAVHRELGLDGRAMAQLAKSSFVASWLDEESKARHIADIDALL